MHRKKIRHGKKEAIDFEMENKQDWNGFQSFQAAQQAYWVMLAIDYLDFRCC